MSDSDLEPVSAPERPRGLALPAVPAMRVANLVVRTLVLALVGAFVFTSPWPGGSRGGLEVVAFVAAAILLVLWVPVDRAAPGERRRSATLPWALASITLLCGAASAVPTGGMFVLLGITATISAGGDVGVAVGLLVLGLGIAGTEAAGLALDASTSTTVEYPILLVLGFVLGRNLQAHRLRAEQSERLRDKQATLATLDERARIAREIHDVLAHSLGALAVQIQVARAVLTDTHDESRTVALLDQAHRMATDGLQETRRAVHALRGETIPLPEGLAELSEVHRLRHGTAVSVRVTGDVQPLSPDVALALTRTAQEALVNTAKHAPRQRVAVCLDFGEACTSLVVRNRLEDVGDPGTRPRFATVDGHHGLAGLRERLLLLHGTLTAGVQGDDWVLAAQVPR